MSERNVMAVVTDLIKSGLSVEQTILMNELVMLVAKVQADADFTRGAREANRERMRSVRARAAQCSTVQHNTPSPVPPMINNSSTPLSPPPKISIKPTENPLFEEFWKVYPRKIGKGEARKAFRNALNRATAEEIIAGAKRYAASKPDPNFTKHPGPWLNADRWADETSNVLEFVPGERRRTWAEIKAEKEQK